MDESVLDEMTVRPMDDLGATPTGLPTLHACRFSSADGKRMPGYFYGHDVAAPEYTKPTLWIDGECVTFWFGRRRPTEAELIRVARLKLRFPLTYRIRQSTERSVSEGHLEGLYYLDGADEVRCARVPA